MDNWNIHFHQPKKADELINKAVVVVDANFLLSAYQWRNVTVDEVLKVLNKLSDENRLKIPYQVIKEFSNNRPGILKERINDLETTISGLKNDKKSLNERVPMLENHPLFIKAEELQVQYNEAYKVYKDSLVRLRDEIKNLFVYDKYLTELQKIIKKSIFQPEDIETEDTLIRDAQKRFERKTPPGYKDGKKEENNAGDYIIWAHILKIKDDVIFISNDKKPDWVYQDNKENSISARRELIEEFYQESGGKDFVRVSPKEFISLSNPKLSEFVKQDLSTSYKYLNQRKKKLSKHELLISETLVRYDPMCLIINLEEQLDEYNPEARMIYETLSNTQGLQGVKELVIQVFSKMFEGIQLCISDDKFEDLCNELLIIKGMIISNRLGIN
ncbi:PIN-like domain-containing protein [Niallia sp. NCCP-28]|uniref:PIN-like domain-containing protein n=1 Tax=Niallia sp. NCCP-28 TaxID=2934712 RepID=UPI002085DD6C|nr:PIN-like domain-containing protein [Niallia sp. NCCP-28]GKU82914.1 hypothetical protein NCCP28_23100 [Niallia sp. NCCP-28]